MIMNIVVVIFRELHFRLSLFSLSVERCLHLSVAFCR
jgi:hypothetical protein